jgi:CheY-like chemotaxis protein
MNGTISIESVEGHGTAVKVRLPRLGANVVATAADAPVPRGRNERILFVDDEEPIRVVGSGMLTELGYRVTVAGAADEALRIIEEDPKAFDLLITDLRMPRRTGIDLARLAGGPAPGLPIVLLTGRADEATRVAARDAGISLMMPKPFLRHEIALAVRRALDGH